MEEQMKKYHEEKSKLRAELDLKSFEISSRDHQLRELESSLLSREQQIESKRTTLLSLLESMQRVIQSLSTKEESLINRVQGIQRDILTSRAAHQAVMELLPSLRSLLATSTIGSDQIWSMLDRYLGPITMPTSTRNFPNGVDMMIGGQRDPILDEMSRDIIQMKAIVSSWLTSPNVSPQLLLLTNNPMPTTNATYPMPPHPPSTSESLSFTPQERFPLNTSSHGLLSTGGGGGYELENTPASSSSNELRYSLTDIEPLKPLPLNRYTPREPNRLSTPTSASVDILQQYLKKAPQFKTADVDPQQPLLKLEEIINSMKHVGR